MQHAIITLDHWRDEMRVEDVRDVRNDGHYFRNNKLKVSNIRKAQVIFV